MMKKTYQSLTFKTLVLLFGTSIFFISFIAYSIHQSFSQGFKNIILEDISSIEENISPSIALNLSFGFEEALSEIANTQLKNKKILLIQIDSPQLKQNITFTKGKKDLNQLKKEGQFTSTTSLIDPSVALKIGTLTLVYSNHLYNKYMDDFYKWLSFSIIVFALAIAALGILLYNSLKHLKYLAYSLERFNPNSPTELSYNTTRTDEIGMISKIANKLIIKLINHLDNIKQLHQEISSKEAHLKEAQRIAKVGSWEYDVIKDKLELSDEIYRILGLKLSTNISWGEFLQFISKNDYERIFKTINDAVTNGSKFDIEYELILQDKKVIYIQTKGKVRKKTDGQIKITAVSLDITKDIQNKKIIEKLAYYDALTGLANRTLLKDRMHKAIQNSKRESSQLAVMFLDLDHFKLINDTLGHNVGDDLLIYITEVLKGTIRESDTLARIGGDEFVILLPSINSLENIKAVANKILKALQIKHAIGTHELYITSSIGIAIYPEHATTAEELIRNADTAMYEAKNNGRNSFKIYADAMGNYVDKQMHLEQDLIQAVKNIDEIEIFYQPKIDSITNLISGAEALVRWRHPNKGLIFPDDFIYIAESTGLMIELGNIIIEKTIAQLSKWEEQELSGLKIAINLSPRQFQSSELVSFISSMIKKYQINPEQLEFEITETLSMANTSNTLRILNELKVIGVSIAIDDFGTGHSSLSYLKKFPIDTLKIDKSFVMDITEDDEDRIIVQTIISMSHSLGFDTVAEGVETIELVNLLRNMDCNQLQGYYYSKPIPQDEFTRFLKEYNPNS